MRNTTTVTVVGVESIAVKDVKLSEIHPFTLIADDFDNSENVVGAESAQADFGFTSSSQKPEGMGEVDSGKAVDLSVIKRDGVYYVSLCDWSLLWGTWSPMRGAFMIWLMSLKEDDVVVIDGFQQVSSMGMSAWSMLDAAGAYAAIEQSPAKFIFRVNSMTGGHTAVLAFMVDELQVGDMGELYISPVRRTQGDWASLSVLPFVHSLYDRAVANGIITEEEAVTLKSVEADVVLTREDLLSRGVKAVTSLSKAAASDAGSSDEDGPAPEDESADTTEEGESAPADTGADDADADNEVTE